MRIKLLLFGEALNIPSTSVGLGVGLLSVWVDGEGFTSASNDLGTLGYILLETPEVEIGEVDEERRGLFSNLHARVVTFDIKSNIFFKNGGIARITLTIPVEQDGSLVNKAIEFLAEDCTGVSVLTNALSFSSTMLQMEKKLADLDGDTIVSSDDVIAAADEAPAIEDADSMVAEA